MKNQVKKMSTTPTNQNDKTHLILQMIATNQQILDEMKQDRIEKERKKREKDREKKEK